MSQIALYRRLYRELRVTGSLVSTYDYCYNISPGKCITYVQCGSAMILIFLLGYLQDVENM